MQRHVAHVAEERRPDGSYEYQVVIWIVPRQTGKTTGIRAIGTKRALQGRDVFYTAQTGKDARARWMDLVKILRLTPGLRDRVKIALRGGSEHVMFPGGGVFQCFAPTAESLHGYTPPTVMLDESFAHTAAEGELLMGAIEPAQQTVVDRQLWIVSTMGTAESLFLHDWVDRAMGGMDRVALFYWGAADHHDPFNLDDIAEFHPGVGQVLNGKTMTAADILAASERMSRSEYLRAYANRRTSTTATLIPAEKWDALAVDDLAPPADSRAVTLTYDVDEHAASASIVAVWEDEATGKPAAKIVQHGPGTAWVADAVDACAILMRPERIAAVGNGPGLDVTAQVRALGYDVDELSERDYAAATTGLLTAVDTAQLVHDGDPILGTAIAGLVTRSSVVDGVAFSRRHSVGASSPAIALAAGLHRHRHASTAAPLIRF